VTSGANGAGSRLAIPADRWFEVKVHVGLNTPGKDDGVLEVSVDGVKGVALKDVRWRQAGVTTPVNMLMAETFYNSPGAPKDGHIDFRDFRVTSGASTPAPPTTPAPTKPPVTTPAAPALASERAFREVSNGWGPVEVNRSNGTGKKGDGGVLKIGTTTFTKGFGVHAASEVVVPVQGARKFTASVGLDADAGKKGTVVFQVFDGTRKLADSGLLKGGSGPRTLTADVTGAKEVRLVVTNAGDGSSQDHSVWGNPRFS
jgi:hypothetical protein